MRCRQTRACNEAATPRTARYLCRRSNSKVTMVIGTPEAPHTIHKSYRIPLLTFP